MGRMKDLWIKYYNGETLTKKEQEYITYWEKEKCERKMSQKKLPTQ